MAVIPLIAPTTARAAEFIHVAPEAPETSFRAAIWVQPALPVLQLYLSSTTQNYLTVAIPAGVNVRISDALDLAVEASFLSGREGASFGAPRRDFGYFILSAAPVFRRRVSHVANTGWMFLQPKVIYGAYVENVPARDTWSHTFEGGLDAGWQGQFGRLFVATALGVSFGRGFNVATTGHESAIWAAPLRTGATTRVNRNVFTLNANVLRVGYAF